MTSEINVPPDLGRCTNTNLSVAIIASPILYLQKIDGTLFNCTSRSFFFLKGLRKISFSPGGFQVSSIRQYDTTINALCFRDTNPSAADLRRRGNLYYRIWYLLSFCGL